MLVLAGVSLNAIVGDNGILNQAKKAKIASDKASILELLDTELASYNIDTITGNPAEVQDMMINLQEKGVIDTVLCNDGYRKVLATEGDVIASLGLEDTKYLVEKGGYYLDIVPDDNGIFKASYGEKANLTAGGKVEGGFTVVTDKAFESAEGVTNPADKGKFTIEDDATVTFTTEIGKNDEKLSILVKAGKTANIYVKKNMTLTNAGLPRSAIDIEPGGTLNLWIASGATVTVDSGFGAVGATAEGSRAGGGMGGYAGIHVPKFSEYNKTQAISYNKETESDIIKTNVVGSATLNVSGDGTLICYGGNAGAGGSAISGTCGGGRWRWSRCWNWWKSVEKVAMVMMQ